MPSNFPRIASLFSTLHMCRTGLQLCRTYPKHIMWIVALERKGMKNCIHMLVPER
jgi:hypothetical protein